MHTCTRLHTHGAHLRIHGRPLTSVREASRVLLEASGLSLPGNPCQVLPNSAPCTPGQMSEAPLQLLTPLVPPFSFPPVSSPPSTSYRENLPQRFLLVVTSCGYEAHRTIPPGRQGLCWPCSHHVPSIWHTAGLSVLIGRGTKAAPWCMHRAASGAPSSRTRLHPCTPCTHLSASLPTCQMKSIPGPPSFPKASVT